ncbi:hypothetical protein NA57DRAFT_55360 [Rhizodiscina lignyota]|uniref:Uncharacterized protein n=1 Tax=Rhizodiscina lignyota TaxID=1504668 RepID=A0A9P4IHH8_9PEZI|nr:hypothetical protein NA57DRAFT_55360 [Rhizodiscina lignyota]
MYITSELFLTPDSPNCGHHDKFTSWDAMPGATIRPVPLEVLGKRKRRLDAVETSKQNASPLRSKSWPQDQKQALPYPASDVAIVQTMHTDSHSLRPILESPHNDETPEIHPSKIRRKILPPKLHCVVLSEKASGNKAPPRPPSISPVLQPCHICHKAPKLKTDLDAYIDCSRCNERTCYICIRQCVGGCQGNTICSGCCVEEGEDGTVFCLGCLAAGIDLDMDG